MKHLRLLSALCLIMFIGIGLRAETIPDNEIWYEASEKLTETTSMWDSGLYIDAFNVSIQSHTFSNGKGVIKFYGTVTSIGDEAFCKCSSLASVTIPNSVTSIGNSAFSDCSGLTSITIPNSVTSIGDLVFAECSSLMSLVVPGSVKKIWSDAFKGCTSLRSAGPIGSGCNYEFGWTDEIPKNAFSGCDGLTRVTLPNSVTSIGYEAFEGCSSLTSIEIPNSVTSIGDWVFAECSSLMSLVVPGSVKEIGSYAFKGCTSLRSAGPIGSGCDYEFGWTDEIPHDAFSSCDGLTTVTLPSSVMSIGNYAFEGCSGLKSIEIPNSVTSIGNYAFWKCSGLTSVTIGSSVTSIGDCAFLYCSSLTSITIPNSVTSIGDGAFSDCSGLTSIEIPNSVTSIGEDAFCDCSGLTTITIPNSVTSIGHGAFSRCKGLKSIYVSWKRPLGVPDIFYYWDNQSTPYEDDVDFTTCILYVPEGSASLYMVAPVWINFLNIVEYDPVGIEKVNGMSFKITGESTVGVADMDKTYSGSVEIPTSVEYKDKTYSVTSIENSAFSDCSGLTSITIPNSVTSIGESAFSDCSGLTSITIPSSVTSIGESAFSGCSSLASITIPSTVTSIGDNAFKDCYNLESVFMSRPKPMSVDQSIFDGVYVDGWILATLYVPYGSKEMYALVSPWKYFYKIVECDVAGIENVKIDAPKGENVYYNLNGQRVNNPTNGIFILNGKKVLIK